MTAFVERADDYFLNKQANDTWSNYFRGRRFALIEQKIRAIASARGHCRIIDVGGRVEYRRLTSGSRSSRTSARHSSPGCPNKPAPAS